MEAQALGAALVGEKATGGQRACSGQRALDLACPCCFFSLFLFFQPHPGRGGVHPASPSHSCSRADLLLLHRAAEADAAVFVAFDL